MSDKPKGNGIKMMAFVLLGFVFLCRSLLAGFVQLACRNIFAMPFLCGYFFYHAAAGFAIDRL
jgi:hypothetical protein